MVDDSRVATYALSDVYEIGLVLHCVCAIVRIGVPDRLAGENLELSDLAASVGACEEPLWRVLRFLAAHGLMTLEGRRIGLTDTGRRLCKDHPQSMWSSFAAIGPVDAAHALTYTLRTGNAAIEKALGASLWGYLAAHPREQEIFNALMSRHAREQVSPYIGDLEWPADGTIADIGGGVGTLLAAVLEKVPGLHGVLVEQPQVIAQARAFLNERQVIDRCELTHGELFTPPPRADVYLLAFVLHDWTDEEAVQILSAIGEGAAPSATLRIFERLIANDDSPQITKMFDVGMLLLTKGRERTSDEMDCLLERAGWEIEEISSSYDPINMVQARRVSR